MHYSHKGTDYFITLIVFYTLNLTQACVLDVRSGDYLGPDSGARSACLGLTLAL